MVRWEKKKNALKKEREKEKEKKLPLRRTKRKQKKGGNLTLKVGG